MFELIPLYFVLSVLISFIVLLLSFPSPMVIKKNPSIKDKVSDLFEDDNGVCYRYIRHETPCLKTTSSG